MTIQIFGHAKCKATRAAQRFFAERKISVQSVDILAKGLSKGELESVVRAVGGIAAVFDSDGPRAHQRGLPYMKPDNARMFELLQEDPRLYRTPIVRDGTRVTVGAAESVWKDWLRKDAARAG